MLKEVPPRACVKNCAGSRVKMTLLGTILGPRSAPELAPGALREKLPQKLCEQLFVFFSRARVGTFSGIVFATLVWGNKIHTQIHAVFHAVFGAVFHTGFGGRQSCEQIEASEFPYSFQHILQAVFHSVWARFVC